MHLNLFLLIIMNHIELLMNYIELLTKSKHWQHQMNNLIKNITKLAVMEKRNFLLTK